MILSILDTSTLSIQDGSHPGFSCVAREMVGVKQFPKIIFSNFDLLVSFFNKLILKSPHTIV